MAVAASVMMHGLQHSNQALDILFIYKGKAIIAKESKRLRYLKSLKYHKEVDCRIPLG